MIKNNIREANKSAHLWPLKFSGVISWFVNRPVNHVWTVISRLLIHRDVGAGKRSQGRSMATRIRGIPKR